MLENWQLPCNDKLSMFNFKSNVTLLSLECLILHYCFITLDSLANIKVVLITRVNYFADQLN